jgi:hypothetical protein
MERAPDLLLEDLRPQMDGTAGFDIEMRRHNRAIDNQAILEDYPIQLTHIPDVIRHGQESLTEIIMIEQTDFF